MKMKEGRKKKQLPHKKFCGERKDFTKAVPENCMTEPISMNFRLLIPQTMEVTNSLVTDESGGKGWFIVRSRTTSAIKLTMAGT